MNASSVRRAAAVCVVLLSACQRTTPTPVPTPAPVPTPPVARADTTRTPRDTSSQPRPGALNVDPVRPRRDGELRGASSLPTPPANDVAREFRGVWVATVDNIDWPSRRDLSTAEQQRELDAILDRARDLGMNALIFQVRPAADALYQSSIEPWSEYLTGRQGTAPSPAWDPLSYVVAGAHSRGMELHAWFNPYRAKHPSARGELTSSHVAVRQPSIVKRYGTHLWMDPGEPEVLEQSLRVVEDVVRRYDVDGVHVDDYFYPYKERNANGVIDFPDGPSYARYTQGGGTLSKDDWRRDNVDRFVQQMYLRVKRAKAWVKVGISPFGIWRPGYPADVRGFDSFAELYGDSRRWLREGWLDYATPQLYWPIDKDGQRYPSLLNWWAGENVMKRHMWPGNYTSRVGTAATWPADELVNQITVTRQQGASTGNIHFSMAAFMPPRGGGEPRAERHRLAERLQRDVYAQRALVPASPWLSGTRAAPLAPASLMASDDNKTLTMTLPPNAVARTWVLRRWNGAAWNVALMPAQGASLSVRMPPGNDGIGYWVSWVDRVGVESPRVGWLRTSDGVARFVAQ
jgi:uncharacterized lipoprotein YddW (UPF0748 family)